MDNRSWLWVGLFGGIAALILVWLLASGTDPSTAVAVERAGRADEIKSPSFKTEKGLPKLRAVKAELDPAKLSARQVAQRPRVGLQPIPDRFRQKAVALPGSDVVFALDSEGIAAAVDSRLEDLKACYETALFHTPDLEGQIVLTLQVEPVDGEAESAVRSVETDSELDATILEGCIATVFEELRFESGDATTINYPVNLSPSEE